MPVIYYSLAKKNALLIIIFSHSKQKKSFLKNICLPDTVNSLTAEKMKRTFFFKEGFVLLKSTHKVIKHSQAAWGNAKTI